eukprot:scaffold45691_cov18-Tisochrysis_lutea.AAC.1
MDLTTTHSQFLIQSAGPFSVPGQYRVRVILYDGYQPVEAGPDLLVGASTSRKSVDIRRGGVVSVQMRKLCEVRLELPVLGVGYRK